MTHFRLLRQTVMLGTIIAFLTGCMHDIPKLGVENNRLQPCPDKPNCIASHPDTPESQKVSPILYTADQTLAYDQMEALLENRSDAIIVTREHAYYLRADFKTPMLGFIDDVEFYFQVPGVIAVRSASRFGYSDFGTNKRRINDIRERFSQLMAQPILENKVPIQTD
ncbi:DUF1499 domain-containing protein [Oceanospirillum maris]|uniref:DUF1499 domain-containing protein n=1 Tax=Oceanospirillum maris TaxID=64977 RepID=UPI0004213047|nr:DUF1499 domain-containing protein [Oceanospirillum maris]